MQNRLCEMFGIEFPIFAFTHCRDVAAAVSRAGGMGVLGALAFSPDQLELELKWIDEHVDGKPYGVDVVIPVKSADRDMGLSDEKSLAESLYEMITEDHWTHIAIAVRSRCHSETSIQLLHCLPGLGEMWRFE